MNVIEAGMDVNNVIRELSKQYDDGGYKPMLLQI